MTGGTVTVYVVDDHPLVSGGVETLFAHAPDLRVVGRAATADAAIPEVGRLRPQVVLLDLSMPGTAGSEAVRPLLAASPGSHVVIFTAYSDHPAVGRALAAGAHGALLKDAASGDLVSGLRRICAGEVVLDPRLDPTGSVGELQEALRAAGITEREYDVLLQVARGRTNPEIGEVLGITRNTVKAYLQSCMRKLGARNRIEVITRASEKRLL